ncbi:MAG: hypothetical protein GTO54_07420, partial [Nitrososphaeria archaeon]|nr:hypothetical protein [Nitrososphaeria archaeon]
EDYIPKVFKSPKQLVIDVATRAKEVLEKAGGEKALRKMTPGQYRTWRDANPEVDELAFS